MKPAEILLVEDSASDVDILKEVMEDSRIVNNLHVVMDGVEALEYLHNEGKYKDAIQPDIILLDLNLPKKDGREVLREIKEDPRLRRIPVVVLTSSQAESDIVKSYDLHANCYISKPLNLEEFAKIIREIEGFWFSIVRLPPVT